MMRGMSNRAGLVLVAVLASCTPDGNATFDVRESVEQLDVTHAPPGATLTLVDALGAVVQTGVADDLGSYLFRHVPAGRGYLIKADLQTSRHLRVLAVGESLPDQD